jgi:hypothetical protein
MKPHETRQTRQTAPHDAKTGKQSNSASVLIEERSGLNATQAAPYLAHPVPNGATVLSCATHDGAEPETSLIPLFASAEGTPPASAPVFEPVVASQGEALLMLNAPGNPTRVNGVPAPLVVPLAIGDQIALASQRLLHVSKLQSVVPRHPREEVVGEKCDLCMLEFSAETLVVLCPKCGAARHMEDESFPEEERLTCAALGPCPRCLAELPKTDGFVYWPEEPK